MPIDRFTYWNKNEHTFTTIRLKMDLDLTLQIRNIAVLEIMFVMIKQFWKQAVTVMVCGHERDARDRFGYFNS